MQYLSVSRLAVFYFFFPFGSSTVMIKKMYVGNLAFQSTEDDIQELFSQFGEVKSVNLITDRETGRSRGFAFVEMPENEADAAMQSLDGTSFEGRNLKVNEARPRT
jgi:RNA recognition motif-containing protein